jgi:DNA helicase-2/ATP-dependent DNA helicase PcrA
MPRIEKIFGPPGTGKTATLLEMLASYLEAGVPPSKIGYLAFTVKAATEAKERASRIKGVNPTDLVWFKTIHAFCYKVVGYERGDIMQKKHYREVCESINVDYSGFVDMSEGDLTAEYLGDRLIFFEGLAAARNSPLQLEFDKGGIDCSWGELELFHKTLSNYKQTHAIDDFNDMLRHVAFGNFDLPDLEVLFVDEAQDLSRLQWLVIERIMQNVRQVVYCAGDDDQAIFNWAGAASELFLGLPGETTVLGHSYRLPKKVHKLAVHLSGEIRFRQDKQFTPRDSDGDVQYRSSLGDLDLDRGNWLILARNAYLLKEAHDICYQEGYSYEGRQSYLKAESLQAIKAYESLRAGHEVSSSEQALIVAYGGSLQDTSRIWHEALTKLPFKEREYFLAARRRGESLLHPRIKISTIHGAKGGEADNVVVYSDMAFRSYNGMLDDPDAEQRVFYVAVTRAKENLFIIEPQSNNFFSFPHSL